MYQRFSISTRNNFIRKVLFYPLCKLLPGWITKSLYRSGFATSVLYIILNGCFALFIRINTCLNKRLMQVSILLILPEPQFQGTGWKELQILQRDKRLSWCRCLHMRWLLYDRRRNDQGPVSSVSLRAIRVPARAFLRSVFSATPLPLHPTVSLMFPSGNPHGGRNTVPTVRLPKIPECKKGVRDKRCPLSIHSAKPSMNAWDAPPDPRRHCLQIFKTRIRFLPYRHQVHYKRKSLCKSICS